MVQIFIAVFVTYKIQFLLWKHGLYSHYKLDIITNCNNNNFYHLTTLYDVLDIPNLISTSNTCSKSSNHTSIETIAAKRSGHFHKTSTITIGLSDFHKLVLTFFKSCLSQLAQKILVIETMHTSTSPLVLILQVNHNDFEVADDGFVLQ